MAGVKDYTGGRNNIEWHQAIVTTEGTEGFVPSFLKNFLDFHERHSNDIEGSAFKETLDTIVSNLNVFLGFLPECLMAIADPVIANNGNYINDRTDLTVGGKHKLEVRRFYNALMESIRVLDLELNSKTSLEIIKENYSLGEKEIFYSFDKRNNYGSVIISF